MIRKMKYSIAAVMLVLLMAGGAGAFLTMALGDSGVGELTGASFLTCKNT